MDKNKYGKKLVVKIPNYWSILPFKIHKNLSSYYLKNKRLQFQEIYFNKNDCKNTPQKLCSPLLDKFCMYLLNSAQI